jgi:hypothetical protein
MKTTKWILFVLVALFAVPAFAQHFELEREINESDGGGGGSFDVGQYLDNPCTPEYDWTYVDYNVLVEQAYMETGGVGRYLFNEATQASSTRYSAAGTSKSDVTYATPFTLRKYHKVNTFDNFHVVTVIDFDPATESTSVSVETACGTGLPDSAQ